jgi:hypothetical protein
MTIIMRKNEDSGRVERESLFYSELLDGDGFRLFDGADWGDEFNESYQKNKDWHSFQTC